MRKEFWVICTTHLSIELYFLVHVTLLPVFIEEFRLSLPEAALVATAPTLLSLVANLPSGFVADRLNVKPILLLCLLLEALGGLIAGQSPNVYVLVLGITLIRVTSPFYHNSALASISKLFARERTSKAMGYHNAFGSIGTSVGSLAVSAILLRLNWRWAYLIWVAPLLAWALVISRTHFPPRDLEPLERAAAELRAPRRRRLEFKAGFLTFSFSAFLLAMSLWQAGFSVVSTFATTYFVQEKGLSESTASLIFGLGPLLGIGGSLLGGHLGDRIGEKKAIISSVLGSALSLAPMAVASTPETLALTYGLYTCLTYSVWSPQSTMVAGLTPPTRRGAAYSTIFFLQQAVSAASPILASGVILLTGLWAIFPIGLLSIAVTIACLQLVRVSVEQKGPG